MEQLDSQLLAAGVALDPATLDRTDPSSGGGGIQIPAGPGIKSGVAGVSIRP